MSNIDKSSVALQLTSVGDYVRFATTQFNQAELYFGHGSDNAWDEAITLIMHVLALPESLFSQTLASTLTSDERLAVLEMIEQRIITAKPAAYLTNHAMFSGLPFYVDERVLVPRSPIGELIENKFTSLIYQEPKRILDLCTGSGCIAIACAHQFPDAEVDALDLSVDALDVTQINIENHGLSHQVVPIESDIFSRVQGFQYDLIVSNPPYVDQEDVDSLPQEFLHEPEMGLGSGDDGLDIVRKILAQAALHLHDEGVLICEVGNSQIHIERVYPEVPFKWLEFERGGHGVFMLTKNELEQFKDVFTARITR